MKGDDPVILAMSRLTSVMSTLVAMGFTTCGIHGMRELSPISIGVILLGMSISKARR